MARETPTELHDLYLWTQKHPGKLAPSKTPGRDKFRLELFESQKGQCYWHDKEKCKLKDVPLSLERVIAGPTGKIKANPAFASFEHVVCRYDGGTGRRENLALSHAKCNHAREKSLPPNGMKYRHLLPDAHLRKRDLNQDSSHGA